MNGQYLRDLCARLADVKAMPDSNSEYWRGVAAGLQYVLDLGQVRGLDRALMDNIYETQDHNEY